MPKTPEEIAAEEAANKEQREALAREANKKRNDQLLEQRNAIADSADEIKNEEDDLEDLTDEVWDQNDRPDQVTKKSRAQRLAEQEEQDREAELAAMTEDEREAAAAAELLRNNERDEDALDEARAAGADDARRNEAGDVEYRVEVAGEEKWLTLAQLRASAGQGDSGQPSKKGATTPATQGPTPEQREAQRLADEVRRKTERDARKAKFKDLQLRASMGDEEAIDELADIQADSTRVTPEELERMVDQRVDARVVGKTAFDQAVAWFESKDGYARELSAPGFKQKAAVIDKRLFDEHPDWSPRQRLDATGKELRRELTELQKFLGVKPGTTPAHKRDEPPTRLARKAAAADEVPRASGRARTETEPDEVQTSRDAISQLARGRGQQRPISH